MQGLQTTFHLQKNWLWRLNITPMPSCCVSFMLCFGGKNDSCNDKKILWTDMCYLILHLQQLYLQVLMS